MVRHIVAWNFKEEITQDERITVGQKIKADLEALVGVIDGIISLKVYTEMVPPKSNRDIVLDSLYVSEEALAAYQVHPAHVKVAEYVASMTTDRACMDYYE
ncbi:MAG: Dabb family protein [Defluviitaleaceae bacterium]|nr:Dabb family protein [Defluviitaleaceae bacterium]